MSAVPPTPAENLRMALELSETGERLMLQNLKRRFPAATAEELDRKLVEWLRERPTLEAADAEGRSVFRLVRST
jgi:hypothetical protein